MPSVSSAASQKNPRAVYGPRMCAKVHKPGPGANMHLDVHALLAPAYTPCRSVLLGPVVVGVRAAVLGL
eukprot:6740142-Alexandrium_andersonii.AAC.1